MMGTTMYLLDTDNMSAIERESPASIRLKARIANVPPDDIATSIVSYEEQTRGWIAVSANAETPEKQIKAFLRLKAHLQIYCKIAIVDYDAKAAAEFERLKRMRLGMGTKDLQIAAIALANNAILLSRNLRDFGKVPGLIVEDWLR